MVEEKKIEEKNEKKVETQRVSARETRNKLKRSSTVGSLKLFGYFSMAMLAISAFYFIYTKNAFNTFLIFSGTILLFSLYLLMRKRLKRFYEVKRMEEVFPEFISLMSSNLRAGMTVDRALVLSAREEFAPLDKEIMQVGKDILTAREVSQALYDMGQRIGSEDIKKTIQLLISGIRSGGNLAVLLEQTSNNMRERNFVKKRAASNVLMYVIFIFFAVAIGAPLLFGLSSVLVQIMTSIFADVPTTTSASTNLPFAINNVSISVDFVIYFATFFIIASGILASLILGLVVSGDERDGFRYTLPLIVIGLTVFFVARFFLTRYFVNIF